VSPAQVGGAALSDEEEPVKGWEELRGRLVYGADDGLALPGQAAQQAHHRGRHEGVQAARRLVAEQERRIS